jgi:hypothetical protein
MDPRPVVVALAGAVAQQAITEEAGIRFGIDVGALFALTAVVVAGDLRGGYGVLLLLLATTVLAGALDGPYALLLGLAGWSFATGFAVNTFAVLTVAPLDLLRMAVFVVMAVAVPRSRGSP